MSARATGLSRNQRIHAPRTCEQLVAGTHDPVAAGRSDVLGEGPDRNLRLVRVVPDAVVQQSALHGAPACRATHPHAHAQASGQLDRLGKPAMAGGVLPGELMTTATACGKVSKARSITFWYVRMLMDLAELLRQAARTHAAGEALRIPAAAMARQQAKPIQPVADDARELDHVDGGPGLAPLPPHALHRSHLPAALGC